MGPRLEVMAEADIAITGAQIPVSINGQTVAIWSGVRVNPGDVLSFGQVESGCRAYLAVTGGIDVPIVMPIGMFLVDVFGVIIGIAIIKDRLFDITIIIKRGALYSLLAAILLFAFSFRDIDSGVGQ